MTTDNPVRAYGNGSDGCETQHNMYCECPFSATDEFGSDAFATRYSRMMAEVQATLYHQWSFCFWDLRQRLLSQQKSGTHSKAMAERYPRLRPDFENWESHRVVGVDFSRSRCVTVSSEGIDVAPNPAAESGPAAPSCSVRGGPRQSGQRNQNVQQGHYAGERRVNDNPHYYSLAVVALIFSFLYPTDQGELMLPLAAAIFCLLLGGYSFIYGFIFPEGPTLEHTLRELRQQRERREIEVASRAAAAEASSSQPQEPGQSDAVQAEGATPRPASPLQAADGVQEPSRFNLAAEETGDATHPGQEYTFIHRFLYQLFVMFVFTLLPWWSPNPRLTHDA